MWYKITQLMNYNNDGLHNVSYASKQGRGKLISLALLEVLSTRLHVFGPFSPKKRTMTPNDHSLAAATFLHNPMRSTPIFS
jgi:hypothetical protein